MTTQIHLEQKPLFRLSKIIFIIFSFLVIGLTMLVWFLSREKILNTNKAYIVCNHAQEKRFQLTVAEKEVLQNSYLYNFPKGSDAAIRIAKLCYQDYSGGKDPELALEENISLFREIEKGLDGRVFTISGIEQGFNWNWKYIIIALIIEYILLQGLRIAGLYVAGGKEALK